MAGACVSRLSRVSGMIAPLMNERDIRVGRRNQELFALGSVDKRVFYVAEVENLESGFFPLTARRIRP